MRWPIALIALLAMACADERAPCADGGVAGAAGAAGSACCPDTVGAACRAVHEHMSAGGFWCATALDSGVAPVFEADGCAWCYLAVCHVDSAPSYVRVECP